MEVIWQSNCKNYVLDEHKFFYERRTENGVTKYRKLSPLVVSACWEVYVWPEYKSFQYALIGLHKGERVFYKEYCFSEQQVIRFLPIGRDIAYNVVGLPHWILLILENGRLMYYEKKLLGTLSASSMFISNVKYAGGVLKLNLQKPRYYSGERYFLQTEDWYKEINAEHAKQIMQNAKEELHYSFE